MPVPADRRIAKYLAKFDTTVIKSRYDAVKTGALNNFGSAATAIVAMEDAVQTVLNEEGIQGVGRPKYYNFAREIWTVVNAGMADPALTSYVVNALKPKYLALDCALATLQAIALNVFSITIPGP
jgi:hypothetical protein